MSPLLIAPFNDNNCSEEKPLLAVLPPEHKCPLAFHLCPVARGGCVLCRRYRAERDAPAHPSEGTRGRGGRLIE